MICWNVRVFVNARRLLAAAALAGCGVAVAALGRGDTTTPPKYTCQ